MLAKKWTSRGLMAALVLAAIFQFQNCADVSFETITSQDSCSPDPNDPCHGVTITLKTLQPAVAVRGATCLMCHAEIRANVITDFGYGSDWYWGGPQTKINDASWFNNYVNTWQHAASVTGQIFVPDEYVPTHTQKSVTEFASLAPMKIAEFMTTAYKAPNNWGGNTPQEGLVEMAFKVSVTDGKPRVAPKSQIIIAAPSEEEIAALAPSLFASSTAAGIQRIGTNADVQLSVVSATAGQSYVANNDEQLNCSSGNIVVKGTLFLRNLKVQAAGGCRLYVSGSVFIQGAITYGTGENQNLQITSANGIFLGLDATSVNHRLIEDARSPSISGSRSYTARAQQAVEESRKINGLMDADPNRTKNFESIQFQGLLLNAPMIHSRYLGLFKGSIIAELALFNLGNFRFEFDPVFTKVNAFPLLKNPILVVK